MTMACSQIHYRARNLFSLSLSLSLASDSRSLSLSLSLASLSLASLSPLALQIHDNGVLRVLDHARHGRDLKP